MIRSGRKSWISWTCRSVMPPAHRHDRAAQPLRAVVGAQPAGEQAVAVGVVQDVTGPAARGPDAARHDRGPHVEVVAGVADHGGLAGRAGGGVDPDHLFPGDGEHPERVVVTKVGLGGEGQPGQVRELLDVVGMHPGGVEGVTVVRDVVVGVPERPGQPLGLERPQLVDRRGLDGLEVPRTRAEVVHAHSFAAHVRRGRDVSCRGTTPSSGETSRYCTTALGLLVTTTAR